MGKLEKVGLFMDIRVYSDGERLWYLLEDVRRVLKKPRIKGTGPAKYINIDRGRYYTVKLRLITAETLSDFFRMYSAQPMSILRHAMGA